MILAIVILLLILIGGLLAWRSEVKDWNNGQCPCGGTWHNFDMDSQGGLGYDCDKCHRTIWISWFTPDAH